MNSLDEKPKNDQKHKPAQSEGTGCSGCLSIVVFFLELCSFFS